LTTKKKPILIIFNAYSTTESIEFKAWFNNSVVDSEGLKQYPEEPMIGSFVNYT